MPDWKGNQGRSGRGKPSRKKEKPPAKSARGWRRERPADDGGAKGVWTGRGGRRPSRFNAHHLKLVATWGAILALLVAFVWFVILAPSPTSVYVVKPGPSSDFGSTFSPAHFVAEDLQRLATLDPGRLELLEEQDTFARLASNDHDQWIKDLNFRGPGKCAVLYLVGQGVVVEASAEDQGPSGPVLLSDAGLENALPLKPFFRALKEAHPNKNKLVILDTARSPVRWELGQLVNQFPGAVKQLVEELKDDHLAVIVSHGDGQNETCLPSQQGSLFAHALTKSLSKAGSGFWLWKSVSAKGLAGELAMTTPNIVQAKSIPVVRPQLFHTAEFQDFPIVYQTAIPSETRDLKSDLTGHFGEIDAKWKRYERLPAASCRARRPLQWARLQASLIALERLAIAGEGASSTFSEESGDIEDLLKDLESLSDEQDTPQSLALWSAGCSSSLSADPFFQEANKQWRSLCGKDKERVSEEDLRSAINGLSTLGNRQSHDLLPAEIQFLQLLLDECDWQGEQRQLPKLVALALKCRDLSEQLAACAITHRKWDSKQPCSQFVDVRLYPWVKSLLGTADDGLEADRRHAEDLLFANKFGDAEEQFRKLLADYQRAHSAAAQIAAAYQLSDEVLLEAPWLAEWALRKADAQTPDDLELANQVIHAIHGARRLQFMLAQNQEMPQANALDFAEGLADRPDYQRAQSYRSLEYGSGSTASKAEDFDINDIQPQLADLQLPFMDSEKRESIHDSLADAISEEVRSWAGAGGAADDNRATPQSPEKSNLEEARRKQITGLIANQFHPAQLLTSSDEAVTKLILPEDVWAQVNSTNQAQAASEVIRQAVAGLQNLQENGGEPLPTDDKAATETLQKLIDRESKLRAGAWLLARTSLDEAKLKQADDLVHIRQHQAAVWLAERSLDDFWGTRGEAGRPYFEQLAKSYHNQAAIIFDDTFHPQSAWADAKLAQLNIDIDDRVTAADSFAVTLSEDPDEAITYAAATPGDFPPGEAVLLVKQAGNLLPMNSRRRTAISIATENVIGKIGPTTGTPTQVEIRYRGHVASASRQLEPESGIELVHEYKPYETPRVKVVGDEEQVVNVMLVLDCSLSMDATIKATRGENKSRMEAAKNSLRELLDLMNLRSQKSKNLLFRVGLMAYGHSYRMKRIYNRKDIERHLTETEKNTDFLKPGVDIPESPFADVQILVELGEFDHSQRIRLERFIGAEPGTGKLKPWGETPLFYSLRRAAERISEEYPRGNNHIVVVTDGVDSKYSGTGDYKGRLDNSLKNLLKDKVSNRVQVIGFAISDSEEKELKKIPGNYTDAKSGTDLTEKLEEWLDKNAKLPQFKITSLQQAKSSEGQGLIDFNQIWKASKISTWQPGEHQATTHGLVDNVSQDLLLEGWEDLTLKRAKAQFLFERYVDESTFDRRGYHGITTLEQKNVDHGTRNSKYWTVASVSKSHKSHGRPNARDFKIAFQNQNADRQSLAPRALWVEVTPVANKTKALTDQRYYFCDVQCEEGKPVPILHWTAPAWPQEASRARVEVWASFSGEAQALHTEPVHSNSPGTAKRTLEFANQTWTLDFSSLAQFRLRRRDKGDLVMVQPVWSSTERVSLTVKRQYAGKPSHDFHLRKGGLAELELRFIDVQKFKEQAWRSQKPMDFPMPPD